MRVTSLMIYDRIRRSLQQSLNELNERNLRLATGKRINKPSDDVSGTSNSIDYRVTISETEQYKRNIADATIQFSFTDKVLTSIGDTLVELKKLTASGLNSNDRNFYSQLAASHRDFFLGLSNSRLGKRHIFSGLRTDQRAFIYNTVTSRYDYQGDMGEINVPVGRGSAIAVNIQGSRVFSFPLSGSNPTSLPDNTPVSYLETLDPATGVNTITVEIGNPGDPDYDTFTISNIMDLANVLSFAWVSKDVNGSDLDPNPSISDQKAAHRIQVLASLIDDARNQVLFVQSEMGTRSVFMNDQNNRHNSSIKSLQDALSKTEDADLTETAVDIKKAETAIEALRLASTKIMSESLLDFIK